MFFNYELNNEIHKMYNFFIVTDVFFVQIKIYNSFLGNKIKVDWHALW